MQLLLAIYNDGRAATSLVREEAENHNHALPEQPCKWVDTEGLKSTDREGVWCDAHKGHK